MWRFKLLVDVILDTLLVEKALECSGCDIFLDHAIKLFTTQSFSFKLIQRPTLLVEQTHAWKKLRNFATTLVALWTLWSHQAFITRHLDNR